MHIAAELAQPRNFASHHRGAPVSGTGHGRILTLVPQTSLRSLFDFEECRLGNGQRSPSARLRRHV
jgi:hypothetical protein